MSRIAIATMASLVALTSGCSSTGGQYRPNARVIDYDEASTFERSLQAREVPIQQRPELVYTQPVNKKEPCKLPSTQDQLSRNNFRSYWDGQCKAGYAYGLGRDIAISDTHHVEEITIHDGSGNDSSAPTAFYDFVNNKVIYSVPDGEPKKTIRLIESIFNNENQFIIGYMLSIYDESGSALITEYSPLNPVRIFTNVQKNIVYKFTDNSAIPVVNASSATFFAEILDPNTRTAGGVVIVRQGNGQVRHVKLNGTLREEILLPKEYVTHINEKYSEVVNAQAVAYTKLERARQMEREYLYMACNGKNTISNLEKETSTKICTWRAQFKVPYENAFAKYTQEIAQMKQDAEAAARQRTAQQQITLQQKRLDQQQTQQELQQVANVIGQMGQQMKNSGQQTLQGVMSQPVPQVTPFVPFTPFAPLGGKQINCINSGVVTNCRY